MENQSTRLFTRADVEQYVLKAFGKNNNFTHAIESVNILPGLTPPTWIVYYVLTWHAGTPREYSYRNSFVVCQKDDYDKPYLMIVVEIELPGGLATPAEEDAEIAQIKAVVEIAEQLSKPEQSGASAL